MKKLKVLWRSSMVVLSYLSSGEAATKGIAVWGISDKLPVSGTATVGVAAYHETGINQVAFTFSGAAGVYNATVTEERLDPSTAPADNPGHPGYPYFYITVNTTQLPDGDYTVNATATPNSGVARTLPQITLRVRNAAEVVRYVDGTNGNDNWDGTAATRGSGNMGPWRTLTKAAQTATQASGISKIVVANGSYAPISGTSGRTSYLTWAAAGGATVTVQSSATALSVESFNAWDGFDFSFTAFDGPGGWINGVYPFGKHHLFFRKCKFQRPSDDHLYFGLNAVNTTDLVVTDCHFRGWGTGLLIASGSYGSVPTTSNVIIRNNTFTKSMGTMAFGLNNTLVEGCRSYDMANYRYPGSDDHPDGIQLDFNGPQENIVIRNNAFWDGGNNFGNWDFLIFDPHSSPRDLAVYNNWAQIYFQAESYVVNLDATATHLCFVHNSTLVDVNSSSRASGLRTTPPWRECVIMNNIIDDLGLPASEMAYNQVGYNVFRWLSWVSALQPGDYVDADLGSNLVDERHYNIRLTSGSPYVQGSAGGTKSGSFISVKYDFDGNRRDASAPARGAFEYAATGITGESPGLKDESFTVKILNTPLPVGKGKLVIEYALLSSKNIRLTLYNALGQKVKKWEEGEQGAGRHSVIWDGRDSRGSYVKDGVYYFYFKMDKDCLIKKTVVVI